MKKGKEGTVMKKIGIMGGTFNPIHFGHLFLAEYAYDQLGLDMVLFMPSKNPPHKSRNEVLEDEYRAKMVELAISDNPHFQLSTLEMEREGTTYTVDTLRILTKENPHVSYYFLVGADSLFGMSKWKEPGTIFKLSTIVAVGRDQINYEKLEQEAEYLKETYGAKIIVLKMPMIQISSASIRERVLLNQSVRYYLPKNVLDYIKDKELYGIHALREKIRDILGEGRYLHSLGVEEVACDLAYIYGADEMKARIAGILHDSAKKLSDEELKNECIKYDIPISEGEKQCPQLLHSKVGAIYAKTKYGVQDEGILNAISYHTTGRPGMSLLEKIIFTADYIEPNRRPIPQLDEIRKLAYEDLDAAVCMILKSTLEYLTSKNTVIDSLTVETYKYYKDLLKSKKIKNPNN